MALTGTDILQGIADAIKKERAALVAYWTTYSTRGLTFANGECYGALIARGFTSSQVASWDRLDEFVLDLGVWYALTRGGSADEVNPQLLASMDRRKELATVQVAVSNAYVNPQAGAAAPGQVNSGASVGVGTGSLFNYPGTDLTTTDALEW